MKTRGRLLGERVRALCVVMALCVSFVPVLAFSDEGSSSGWSASPPQKAAQVESFDAQSSVLRMVGGLFLCFGMLGFGLHIYKRHVLPRSLSSTRRLQVLERLQISHKSSLVLVKFDGKEFLMTTGTEPSRLVPLAGREEGLFDETLASACDEVGEYNV